MDVCTFIATVFLLLVETRAVTYENVEFKFGSKSLILPLYQPIHVARDMDSSFVELKLPLSDMMELIIQARSLPPAPPPPPRQSLPPDRPVQAPHSQHEYESELESPERQPPLTTQRCPECRPRDESGVELDSERDEDNIEPKTNRYKHSVKPKPLKTSDVVSRTTSSFVDKDTSKHPVMKSSAEDIISEEEEDDQRQRPDVTLKLGKQKVTLADDVATSERKPTITEDTETSRPAIILADDKVIADNKSDSTDDTNSTLSEDETTSDTRAYEQITKSENDEAEDVTTSHYTTDEAVTSRTITKLKDDRVDSNYSQHTRWIKRKKTSSSHTEQTSQPSLSLADDTSSEQTETLEKDAATASSKKKLENHNRYMSEYSPTRQDDMLGDQPIKKGSGSSRDVIKKSSSEEETTTMLSETSTETLGTPTKGPQKFISAYKLTDSPTEFEYSSSLAPDTDTATVPETYVRNTTAAALNTSSEPDTTSSIEPHTTTNAPKSSRPKQRGQTTTLATNTTSVPVSQVPTTASTVASPPLPNITATSTSLQPQQNTINTNKKGVVKAGSKPHRQPCNHKKPHGHKGKLVERRRRRRRTTTPHPTTLKTNTTRPVTPQSTTANSSTSQLPNLSSSTLQSTTPKSTTVRGSTTRFIKPQLSASRSPATQSPKRRRRRRRRSSSPAPRPSTSRANTVRSDTTRTTSTEW